MTEKLVSFEPVLPETPKALILGSMPGGVSLRKKEYDGNPRNHFWQIIYGLFNKEMDRQYEDKIAFIKNHHIALWDIIGRCYREGSLDENIVDEQPDEMNGWRNEHPSIRLIACNGSKSYDTFRRYFKPNQANVIKLPSTSPIPGRYTKSFNEKFEEWKQILDYL